MKSPDPEITVLVQDSSRPLGYLVIDRLARGKACGGLRILPDVSLEEIKILARCMTLKFGFVGKPMGGAKAGILMPARCSDDERRERLRFFGKRIAPFLKTGAYFSGTDIGSTAQDLVLMHEGAGIAYRSGRKAARSGYFTAVTVMMGIEAAASAAKTELSGKTIAIEGFGAVGSSVALLMSSRKGMKVAAVSTASGAIHNPDGLDVERLLALRESHGDELVSRYGRAEKITREELLGLDVDVLAPCARHESVHEDNARAVRASIVCGGANYGVSAAAEIILFSRGVLSFPHFMASSGGIIGGRLEMAGLKDDFIERYIRKHYAESFAVLVAGSPRASEPMIVRAESAAWNRFAAMQEGAGKSGKMRKMVCRLIDRGWLPEGLKEHAADVYFGRIAA